MAGGEIQFTIDPMVGGWVITDESKDPATHHRGRPRHTFEAVNQKLDLRGTIVFDPETKDVITARFHYERDPPM